MMDGKRGDQADQASDGGSDRPWKATRAWRGGLDLVSCAALVAVGCLAAAALPAGSALRLALALPVLLFAPGYLLVEAAAGPARQASSRAMRGLLAIGVSPALVGLVALATAGLPGGFRAGSIVLLLAVVCAALAGAALWRRKTHVGLPTSQTTLA